MAKVLLTDRSYHVVVTVRSADKGRRLLSVYPARLQEQLTYVVVPDIAQKGAFDAAVQSDPPFKHIIHTASPYHFNITDPIKDILDPSIQGTVNLLDSIKKHASNVERIITTSSSATIFNPPKHAKVYDESVYGETTWESALDPVKTYRAGKVRASHPSPPFSIPPSLSEGDALSLPIFSSESRATDS
ncbi:MAG: hypothetical protein Q9202_002613 [Teloschistes flavicans]